MNDESPTGRMVQIEDLIKELQEIHRKFGNTCCHVSGLAWGSVALWHKVYDDEASEPLTDHWLKQVKFSPNGFRKNENGNITIEKNLTSDDPRIAWGFTLRSEHWHAQGFVQNRGHLRRICSTLHMELRHSK